MQYQTFAHVRESLVLHRFICHSFCFMPPPAVTLPRSSSKWAAGAPRTAVFAAYLVASNGPSLVPRLPFSYFRAVDLRRRSLKRSQLLVGLMSGTSVDGIDAVVAEIRGGARRFEAKVLTQLHCPFAPPFRRRILQASTHGTVADICELNFELGRLFGKA